MTEPTNSENPTVVIHGLALDEEDLGKLTVPLKFMYLLDLPFRRYAWMLSRGVEMVAHFERTDGKIEIFVAYRDIQEIVKENGGFGWTPGQ